MAEKILEVSDLQVSYLSSRKTPFEKKKRIQVLKDVSFSMEKGEILGLVGESGSGKTTLARAILGMREPLRRMHGEHRWYFRILTVL